MDWFRFYSRVLHDPKIQGLSGNDFKAWVNLLCLANETEPRGSLPNDADVGFALRMSQQRAGLLVARFTEWGLLDLDYELHRSVVHNWDKWQGIDVEERSESGSRGNHVRWHVRLAKPVADCRYCIAERIAPAIAEPSRLEKRREEEIRGEERREEETRPRFDTEWVKHQEVLKGTHPGGAAVAAASQLERDFGYEACMQAARDTEWQKHPNYLRPILEERRDKPSKRGPAETANTNGLAGGVSGLDRRGASIAERRRRRTAQG